MSVLPFGPRIRCRRFTKRSLLRTRPRILITSHATPSSRILIACGAGTDRARSFIRSRAFNIEAGSKVLRVVLTVMLPSTKSRVHAMPCFSSARVMSGQDALRYVSRYLGKRVAKLDSSVKVPPRFCSGVKASSFQWSISSVSHGLSFLYVDGIFAPACCRELKKALLATESCCNKIARVHKCECLRLRCELYQFTMQQATTH